MTEILHADLSCGRRVRYVRIEGEEMTHVIVDRIDGRLEFSEQEWGGVRWYDFDPGPIEHQEALQLFKKGEHRRNWDIHVNLDEIGKQERLASAANLSSSSRTKAMTARLKQPAACC